MDVSGGAQASSQGQNQESTATSQTASAVSGGNSEAIPMDDTQHQKGTISPSGYTQQEMRSTAHNEESSMQSQPDRDEKFSHDAPSGWSVLSKLQDRCSETITEEESTIPLAWQAMLTGLVDALLYLRGTIWTGFQTGNMVQFSENIAQYMLPSLEKEPLLTLLRALSVSSFLVGSFVGGKLGMRFGERKRGWQVASAFIQSLLLFGASGILLSRPADEGPSFRYWPGVVVMTAISMGMQSIAAQKLVSPSFATTVAFTATLTQIASDPYLFTFALAPVDKYRIQREEKRNQEEGNIEAGKSETKEKPKPPRTLGRDKRLLGIFSLCVGGGVGQCLIASRANLRGGLAIAAGFKLVLAFLWLLTPRGVKPVAKET